jgi:hypothetical protein
MPKWTNFFGKFQSPPVELARILLLLMTGIVSSSCVGGPGAATPTPLPPGERIEQPTAIFIAPTPTSTSEPAPTAEINPIQAMVATQIALRALETPEAATPVPTATVAAPVEADPVRRALIDTQLTRPTSMGIVSGGGAGFFASPGGALIQSLPAGSTLTITGRTGDGGWYAAYLGDGRAGWIAVGAARIFGDPGELEIVNQSFSPAIVATLIAEANRPVTPFPTTAPLALSPSDGTTPTPADLLAPVQPTEATPSPAEPSRPQATVIVEGINVRAGPGTEFSIVGSLAQGNTATIRARNEAADWLQIETTQGIGWIFSPLVETSVPVAELPVSTG